MPDMEVLLLDPAGLLKCLQHLTLGATKLDDHLYWVLQVSFLARPFKKENLVPKWVDSKNSKNSSANSGKFFGSNSGSSIWICA